ncbi:MAG: uroporphyrinogen decarboxylase family protein [Desulfotomaculaceae bacterium]|nr:uroporphyrinogen decarboxylase family protein [Desulfotomaculaceae bacterium]
MHKDDQMTPIERKAALAKGQPVDRYPITMFYGAPAHALLGWTRHMEVASARNQADVQKKVYETFGCDGVSVSHGLHGMAIRYGAKMTAPDHVPIAILEHPVKDINDISMLDLADISVEKDPTLSRGYEAMKILQDEIGDECPCGLGLTGPFTTVSALVGTEVLLKNLGKNPEQIHRLLVFATEATKILSEPFLKAGATVMIADPVASGTIISKKRFLEFAAPYLKQLTDHFNKFIPNSTAIHICGDTSKILNDIVDCGFICFSIDNVVDLHYAKEQVGNRIAIMGNVNPNAALYNGTPEEVKKAVRECCQKGWDSPCGYTIATGCDSVYGTPLENSFAFMEEARKCAKYPYNQMNFK